MNQQLQTLREARAASVKRRLRNVLVAAQTAGLQLVRGPCGYYPTCGASFTGWHAVCGETCTGLTADQIVTLPKTHKVCPVCAAMLSNGLTSRASPSEIGDLETRFALLFDLTEDEVVSILQGWDGDSPTDNTKPGFYKIGRQLARRFVEDGDDLDP
jgi:hypothetical protein